MVLFLSIFLSIFCVLGGFSVAAQTAGNATSGYPYQLTEDIAVRSRPNADSKVALNLEAGSRLRPASTERGVFKKVAFIYKGRRLAGYVIAADLHWRREGADVDDEDFEFEKPATAPTRSRFQIYVSATGAYQNQGPRELQTTSDSIYDVSKFTGNSFYFGAGVDLPVNEDWGLRLGVNMRQTHLQGDATSLGGGSQELSVEQHFLGFEVGVRHIFAPPSGWSLVGLVEFDKGLSADLKVVKGPALASTEIETASFVILSGGLYYEWQLARKWSIEPGLKVGAMVNAEPVVVLVEGDLHLKYAW